MFSPFELVFGRKASPIIYDGFNNDMSNNIDEYVCQQKQCLDLAYKSVKDYIIKQKLQTKEYYDLSCSPINVNIGDSVMLVNEVRKKNDPLYTSGYVVVEINSVNVVLRHMDSNKLITVHKNRIRKP